MSLKSSVLLRISLALTVASQLAGTVSGADRPEPKAKPTSTFWSYSTPDGDAYFAVGLRAEELAAVSPHDHVLLVDTSASQKGTYRAQALQVVEAFLAALPETDRVCLLAVDVGSETLTEGFVAPRSEAAQASVKLLRKRVPLGATNFEAALRAARQAFAGDRARSVTYIGDGMSTANLVQSPALRDLLAGFREEQTPVHSYVLGSNVDLVLPGAVAYHTGGTMLVHQAQPVAKNAADAPPAVKVGRELAQAAVGSVFYPEESTFNPAAAQLLPTALPPVRSDRETIVLGHGALAAPLAVSTTGKVGGTERTLQWNVTPTAPEEGNAVLASLWAQAERDQGLSMALAGAQLLQTFRELHTWQVEHLVAGGQQALETNNLAEAGELAAQARRLDPANRNAARILEAVGNGGRAVREVALAQEAGSEENPPADPNDAPAPAPAPDNANDVPEQPVAPQPDLLDQLAKDRAIKGQLLTHDVNQLMERLRRSTGTEPELALDELKRMISTVRTSTDVDPTTREQLLARLEGLRLQITNERDALELTRVEAQRRLALIEASRRMLDQMQLDDEKMQNLIERVRSLMVAGAQGNADAYEEAEAVARAAIELRPIGIEATAALFDAEAAGQLDKARRLRSLRADKFLESLYQVELSHVPFPDEPPILWPAPEVWDALSRNRKEKWGSTDLKRYSKKEDRIRARLNAPTNVEFIDTPLRDALDYLREFHHIDIVLNEAALSEEGIQPDDPVTLQLEDIALRSVLKLLLQPKQLVYLIEDDVMKVTTKADAGTSKSTRVYPVGDLVIPIRPMRLGGMGMMGGMGGMGMGGGMGGMGMGGGMGGMGMGGMGGGMGMGMFNVPPEKLGLPQEPAKPKAKAPKAAPAGKKQGAGQAADPAMGHHGRPTGQAFAQVADDLGQKPAEFNSQTLRERKKKLSPVR